MITIDLVVRGVNIEVHGTPKITPLKNDFEIFDILHEGVSIINIISNEVINQIEFDCTPILNSDEI